MLFFDKEPDFINDEGTKWWIDKVTTQYAQKEDSQGTKLPNVHCFYIELKTGEKLYVLVENNEIIYETQSLEQVGIQIDILKLLKRSK